MDPVSTYPDLVKRVLREYASFKPSYGDVQVETIFDDAQGHFEVMYAGWASGRRVHGSVLHVDIRDGKIWIQHDGTERGVAEEFVAAGVPKENIVLAFHSPAKRKLTPYAHG
jgi:hypothetical protein